MSRAPSQRPAGFTLLELLIAMTIFAILGTSAVFLMRQGAALFTAGARDSELADRQDTLLPELRRDLAALLIPDSFDPPPAPPDPSRLGGAAPPPPPPPVAIRLRSGTVLLSDPLDTVLKSLPCTFLSFVVWTGDEAHHPLLRHAGDAPAAGATPKAYTKAEIDKAAPETVFLPTGGAKEVCWILVPRDGRFPGIQELYRAERSPVGGEGTLLEPASFDTWAEIKAKFDLRHRGVLHFGVTWRRALARSWDETPARAGAADDVPYVGPVWDSTRARDAAWPLFRGAPSLADPSDDLYPQFVRLEATLAPPALGGYGRGETRLRAPLLQDDVKLVLDSLDPLLGPGPALRYVKVGAEWLRFDVVKVNFDAREVLVERGQRGTLRATHEAGADVYVGQAAHVEVQLPVWHDNFVRRVR